MQINAIKKNIALSILLFINFIFAYKYLSRETQFALFVSLGFVFLGWFFLKKFSLVTFKSLRLEIGIIITFCIISFLVWLKIPVESLNVDRWSVITSFWDAYFSNQYVYLAKSNVGNPPGPMPFYFILALPFYLVGELGYLSLLGILFFYALMYFNKIESNKRFFSLLFILSSLFFVWEIASRSNVFFNSSLILGSVIFILNQKKFNTNSILLTSLIIGLTLSTRNVFVIPYIITFLFLLKFKKISFSQVFTLGVLSVVVFSLTFVPFVYNFWDDFLEINPFIVQSTFLIPFEYTMLFIGLAVCSVFLIKDYNEVFFYSGLVLFLSILIYMFYHIFQSGLEAAFLGSIIDISYFILCIPFMIWFYIKE